MTNQKPKQFNIKHNVSLFPNRPKLQLCFKRCQNYSLWLSAAKTILFLPLSTEDLKKVLLKNGYPQGIISFNINDVLNRNNNKPNDPVQTVPQKDVIILLPYLGLHCHQITKRLKSCINNFYSFVNVKVRPASFFPYKDRLNRSQLSKVIYKANCWNCDDFYIGKTKRRLHDRKTEHFKALTKYDHSSAIADHIKTTGHNIKWDNFDILASGKTDYHCKIKETLFIYMS